MKRMTLATAAVLLALAAPAAAGTNDRMMAAVAVAAAANGCTDGTISDNMKSKALITFIEESDEALSMVKAARRLDSLAKTVVENLEENGTLSSFCQNARSFPR